MTVEVSAIRKIIVECNRHLAGLTNPAAIAIVRDKRARAFTALSLLALKNGAGSLSPE